MTKPTIHATGGKATYLQVLRRRERDWLEDPAFRWYHPCDALEHFVTRVGLLSNHSLANKASLETYLLGPDQTVRWVQNRAHLSAFSAMALLFRMVLFNTWREKTLTFRMQKIFSDRKAAERLLESAPERQPYRNEAEIRRLFGRLAVPIKDFRRLNSCFVATL